ncbi:Peptidyl-tRNA hydrolase family protein [Klebsormidium nitens]|uniref:peptidyl-tRNA hydrolase n=1 Tax=Klebsormidium nitens TaxID=105231 RepID=A0A1Y1HV69_KLENI|nr:Peptidyl-tRNA hydrolase family protein [Klebsormidium nitens]|eukprot:GAQ81089.1 Peptidyl-tRNA hydrolase family protein [Klebsormidium nitens]
MPPLFHPFSTSKFVDPSSSALPASFLEGAATFLKAPRSGKKDCIIRAIASSAVSSAEAAVAEKGADTAKRRPKKEPLSTNGGGGGESSGPWLLVGLGNPGSKYAGTRHNVGFELLDELAASEGITIGETKNKALIGKGRIAGTQVVLVKPQTFMNLSGESVGPLARFFKIPVERVLVVYDDLDTETAELRLKMKGGHGGHNGMRSIIQHFSGSQAFPRLRIGIGRPPGKMPVERYVLTPFTAKEKEEIAVSMVRGSDAIRAVLSEGIERAVSQWNGARVKV